MDNGPDERDDDVTRTDLPVTRLDTPGPATDRVRIVGAEPAGEAAPAAAPRLEDAPGDETVDLPLPGFDDTDPGIAGVRVIDEPAGASADTVDPVAPGGTAMPSGTTTELPHWTEPPTGQVPAVLARDTGDEGTGADSGILPPAWREEHADWVAHEEEFEPSIFGGEHATFGSLDESDTSTIEKRPWEFSFDPAGTETTVNPITDPVDVVRPEAPAPASPAASAGGSGGDPGHEPSAGVAGVAGAAGAAAEVAGVAVDGGTDETSADAPGTDEELFDTGKPKPTGTTRTGRSRRNGLRPGRLRAKKPAEADAFSEPPLAAEPPGASVTEVPGAGRKRVGVAGLAAADRSAELERELTAEDGTESDASTAAAAAAVATVATTTRRGARRHPPTERRAPAEGARVPTGGGPPARRASRAAAVQQHGRPAEGSSIGMRIGTGVAVAVVALLAFKLGTVTSLILAVVVVTFAAGECFGVLRRAGYHPATLLGLVGTVSLMVGAYTKGVAALPLVTALIVVFTLLWYLFGIERGSPVAGTAATLLTIGWVSLLGSFAGLLLSPSLFPDRHGIAFLVGAIIATVANDVGALVIGGWLGSRPLAPTISPNKTWEGLLGGAVFSILISTVLVGAIHPWTAANAALLGVVVAVVAPVGDLCESLLKRDLRLKDMGTLLPGHGGVLDRVDALLFVLPATYYLVRALNIA